MTKNLKKRACIIGWPVEHSRSPLIHNHWLAEHDIEGEYTKEAVEPGDLASFLKSLEEKNYIGANLTIPHKEAVMEIADEADEAARTIGAANTVWVQNGKLLASNTDAYGFMTYLNSEAPGWNRMQRPCVVLGAGGAAKAVIHGLLSEGASKILVSNRTKSRADQLADKFGERVEAIAWEERENHLNDAGLLVNTTKLGMDGADPLEIDIHNLPFTAIVYDIVYVPLETDLIFSAQSQGNLTIDGLGMLLHQAVPGFEKWFGVRPEVTDELRNKLLNDLGV